MQPPSRRSRPARFLLLLAAPLLLDAGHIRTARSAARPESSRMLSLVSIPYKTKDGTLVPHTSDLDAHAAFLSSRDADVRRVSFFSTAWEVLVSERGRRGVSLEDILPATASEAFRLAGVGDPDTRKMINSLLNIDSAGDGLLGPLIKAQAEANGYDLAVVTWLHTAWNAAETLARSRAGRGTADGLKVSVDPKGVVLKVANTSDRPLNHLTIAARVEKWPLRGAGVGMDLFLGGLMASLTGAEPEQLGKGALMFAVSTQSYYAVRNMPDRVLVHVDRLEPGGELTIPLFLRIFASNITRATAASYSAWADELSVEKGEIEGFRRIIAANRKRNEEAQRRMRGGFPGMNLGRSPFFGPPPSGKELQAWSLLNKARKEEQKGLIPAQAMYFRVYRDYKKTASGAEAKRWLDAYPDRLRELADDAPSREEALRYYMEMVQPTTRAPKELAEVARSNLDAFSKPLWEAATLLESRGQRDAARSLYIRISNKASRTTYGASALKKARDLAPNR